MEWQPLILIDCLLNEAMEVPDGQYALAVLNGQYALAQRLALRDLSESRFAGRLS